MEPAFAYEPESDPYLCFSPPNLFIYSLICTIFRVFRHLYPK